MKLKIRYFGRFAVDIGKFSEEVDVPEGATVRDVLNILRSLHPELRDEAIEVSMDGRYAKEEEEVRGELAIYPPISGG